ncbi:MAG: 16S rRNA (adenine(1518)-N(6)/adenine(1519)-N(6))-dimethyltransferase RsmA [Flavobacteriales bacterium]
MPAFRKKKELGQHFLRDRGIAQKIAAEIAPLEHAQLLEIGPGLGALTRALQPHAGTSLYLVESDEDAVRELRESFPELKEHLIHKDFLELDLEPFSELIITGNFPYSISSPLLVRITEERDRIRELVGMFQKEFADRIRAEPGSKAYGRISVMVQAFYDTSLCFHVEPGSFSPPPKVRSSVVRLKRKKRTILPCDERRFFQVVKQAFGKRRKTLRNALKELIPEDDRKASFFGKRAEELSIETFIQLTLYMEGKGELPKD